MNPGQSQIFLNITERFGLLLAENLDKVSKPLLTSDNIGRHIFVCKLTAHMCFLCSY